MIQTAANRRQCDYTSHYLYLERSLAIALFAYQRLMILLHSDVCLCTLHSGLELFRLMRRENFRIAKPLDHRTLKVKPFGENNREPLRARLSWQIMSFSSWFIPHRPRSCDRSSVSVSYRLSFCSSYPILRFFADSFLTFFILLVSVVAVYTLVHYSQDDCPLARISQENQVHCRVFAAIW